MGSEGKNDWKRGPVVWISGAIISGFIAGFCLGKGSLWWILFAIYSVACSIALMRNIASIQKRLRYVIEATLSGDFSYKFPTSNVNHEEREVNESLNRIVEHFERLTNQVRQNEVFLGCLINLTDIGMAVADAKGDIRLHNDAALHLLERKALTNVCQIPEQAYDDLDIKKSTVTVNDKNFTLFIITDLSKKMQSVEVKSWEKLTRVLTHEIMNSLTPIQSIAETMGGKSLDQEMTDAFETIASSSGSLMQFVRNFREFNRLPEPRMRVLYLKPLLESITKVAANYSSDRHVKISLTCFPPELMIYTDETLLRQVLLNILKNAVEAEASTIEIEAIVKADDSVEISISNDGALIPENTADHIFTPFFSTKEKGSGIGLSLSRRIISHLGGTLTFTASPSTRFSIRL